jgi:hypothetical protein
MDVCTSDAPQDNGRKATAEGCRIIVTTTYLGAEASIAIRSRIYTQNIATILQISCHPQYRPDLTHDVAARAGTHKVSKPEHVLQSSNTVSSRCG